MTALKMPERQDDTHSLRAILEGYQRSKILEVYFARLDGRVPNVIPVELRPLYEIELPAIKAFLLGQYPQDSIIDKFFKIMN